MARDPPSDVPAGKLLEVLLISVTTGLVSSSAANRDRRSWNYTFIFFALIIVCWIIQAIAASHTLDSDGVAYVDIAIACARGHWQAAVNRYWSPAYPVLFSFWLRIFKPSAHSEIGLVRWFDVTSLVGAAVSFEFFLRALLKHRRLHINDEPVLSDWSLVVLGYVLFFWATCYLTPPSVNPPDILVLIAFLLAGTISLRIADGTNGWLNYAALGFVLGFGYLAKAAMFPLSFAFLATIVLAVRKRRILPGLLVSFLAFLVVAGPFLFALSRKAGHLTFGSSGGISYSETVNHVESAGYWLGQEPGNGTPVHSIHKLMDAPVIYEYSMPNGGSLPLWLHHAYWYQGVRPHFDLRGQINVIHICLDNYFQMLIVPLSPLLAMFLLLILLERHFTTFMRRLFDEAVLWIPAVAGFAMYALVHVEARFLPGFVILLWAAFFVSVRLPEWPSIRGFDHSVAVAVTILLGLQIALAVGHNAFRVFSGNPFPEWQVAVKLGQDGIERGDKVCYLGDPVWDDAWALLAKVQIVCNIPAASPSASWSPYPLTSSVSPASQHVYVPRFWAANPALRTDIIAAFEHAGAKAVVGREIPASALSDGWERVSTTDYYVLRLHKP